MIECQLKRETLVEAESKPLNMTTERLDTGLANSMSLRTRILIGALYSLIILKCILMTLVENAPNFKAIDYADGTTFSFYVLPTQVGTQRLQGAVS